LYRVERRSARSGGVIGERATRQLDLTSAGLSLSAAGLTLRLTASAAECLFTDQRRCGGSARSMRPRTTKWLLQHRHTQIEGMAERTPQLIDVDPTAA